MIRLLKNSIFANKFELRMTDKKIAVVGAGASGLFLAKSLSECAGFHVVVFEKNRQVAAKVRASGGGKANIFNRDVRPEHYNHPEFVETLLKNYNPEMLEKQFAKWGLVTVSDEEGRVYPATQFSQTVVDILCDFPSQIVSVETEYEVQSVEYQKNKWIVNDCPCQFDAVVLASGSPANMIPKNSAHYNAYLHQLNLKTKPLQSSLVGFKLKDYPKSLSGCRAKAIVSLFQGKNLVHKELGEVTFKDNGISGIVVMNMSAYYRRLATQRNCSVKLNLTYWDEDFDVKAYLSSGHSLTGLLHPKLLAYYHKKPFNIQGLTFDILETYPLESAQVCNGGIDLSEVDAEFRLHRYPQLYALGEMLDVDGVCGGYNLFFAFASAAVVAKSFQHL